MKLVFVNPLGVNYKGENVYEFLFTSQEEIEAGEDWGVLPASSGQVTPPPVEEIRMVGLLKGNMELELAMKSDHFSFNDAIEKIVALAWEKNNLDHEERLVFHVDESLEDVRDKLYAKDIKLKLTKTTDDDDD